MQRNRIMSTAIVVTLVVTFLASLAGVAGSNDTSCAGLEQGGMICNTTAADGLTVESVRATVRIDVCAASGNYTVRHIINRGTRASRISKMPAGERVWESEDITFRHQRQSRKCMRRVHADARTLRDVGVSKTFESNVRRSCVLLYRGSSSENNDQLLGSSCNRLRA